MAMLLYEHPLSSYAQKAKIALREKGVVFGWADAAAAPMVNRSVHYGLGPPPGSALAGWHRRVRERPSVAATFAEFDAAAARMAA